MRIVQSVGLLLAAGSGTRFDPTQPGRKLEVLIDGTSVAERAFVALADAVDIVIVATRSDESPISRAARQRGALVVIPVDASMGMGHSLAAAVDTLMQRFPDAQCVVVALADMPWVTTATIRLLVDTAMKDDHIVQPRIGGQRGHPVVFPARYAAELAACQGDVGARDVLRKHAKDVRWIDVDDAGVLRDVDAPGDLPG